MITTLRRIWPILAALSWIMAVVLAFVAAGSGTIALDLRISHHVQAWTVPGLNPLTDLTNGFFSGSVLTIATVVGATTLFAMNQRSAAFVMLGGLPLRLLNSVLKDIIASPRPLGDQIHVDHISSGYGFPSGHTVGAVLFLGTCAWLLSRHHSWSITLGSWLVAAFGVVITAVGRIRVGAHWPSDTLGAVLWAAPMLVLLIVATTAIMPDNGKRRGRIASTSPFGLGRWR